MAAITRSRSGQFVAGGGSRPQTITVRMPGGAKKVARRAGGAAARAAWSEKHTITALLAAGALGLAKRQDVELPHFEAVGVPATYGLAAWVAARFTKSRVLEHAATGLLSVAVYELAAGGTA